MHVERQIEGLSFGHEPRMTALKACERIHNTRGHIPFLDSRSRQFQHLIAVVQVSLQCEHSVELFLELGGQMFINGKGVI